MLQPEASADLHVLVASFSSPVWPRTRLRLQDEERLTSLIEEVLVIDALTVLAVQKHIVVQVALLDALYGVLRKHQLSDEQQQLSS